MNDEKAEGPQLPARVSEGSGLWIYRRIPDCQQKPPSKPSWITSFMRAFRSSSLQPGWCFYLLQSAHSGWRMAAFGSAWLQTSVRAPASRRSANSFITNCKLVREYFCWMDDVVETFGSLRNSRRNVKHSPSKTWKESPSVGLEVLLLYWRLSSPTFIWQLEFLLAVEINFVLTALFQLSDIGSRFETMKILKTGQRSLDRWRHWTF